VSQIANKTKVIFFDAGGVLFDTFINGEQRIRNLLMARGYQKPNIDAAIIKAKKTNSLSFITNWNDEEAYYKKYYGAIAKELGEIELTNELFYFTHFASHCRLFPENQKVLNDLSKHYKLAVISNAMPSMDWIFDNLNIRKYFDSIILSAFVEVEKPEKTIYNIALNRMKITAEEGIFIDDKIENVEAAESVGIKGLLLDRRRVNLLELVIENNLLKQLSINDGVTT
jgi:putative hydrolase of the HAD superfamily